MKQGIARVLICAGFLGASLGITAEAQGRPAFDVNIVNTPVPVTIENGARTIVDFRYVGVSSTVDDGRFEFEGLVGVAAMHRACQADYGSGARAASIRESLFRAAGEPVAWIGPGPIALFEDNVGAILPRDMESGFPVGLARTNSSAAVSSAYCSSYRSADEARSGPTIEMNGNVDAAACDDLLPVACSAPVVIPVAP